MLADPDFLNTQGISDIDTARLGMAMLNLARSDNGVVFDVTLNGLETARNLLRLALTPPLLGATLSLLAAAALLAWRSIMQIGAADRPGRAIALGKRALAENSAALIRIAGREHTMGWRYAVLTGATAAEQIGAPRRRSCGNLRHARPRRRDKAHEPALFRRWRQKPPTRAIPPRSPRRPVNSMPGPRRCCVQLAELRPLADRIRAEIAKADRRPGRHRRSDADRAVRRRAHAAGRPAGHGEDACWRSASPARWGCEFGRIQFTPDLMPGDIIGLQPVQLPDQQLHPDQGADLLRAAAGRRDQPHAAQDPGRAAGGDAGARRHHRRQGATRSAPRFMVVATQNPIEQQGAYPLPEAQLDRFLFKQSLAYPARRGGAADRRRAMARASARRDPSDWGIEQVVERRRARRGDRRGRRRSALTDEVVDYVVDLVRATREAPTSKAAPRPRAAAMLAAAARARAALDGRDYVIPDDVKALALPALRHRVILSPAAEIEGRPADDRDRAILDHGSQRRDDLPHPPRDPAGRPGAPAGPAARAWSRRALWLLGAGVGAWRLRALLADGLRRARGRVR